MARFRVEFLGCKVSHTDAHEIRTRLVADGHEHVSGDADVAVLNTCCITREAVHKSRKAVRRAARDASRVYVTGCAANLAGAFEGMPANVVVVSLPSERTPDRVATDLGRVSCARADVGADRIRAFVKIQDGCSFSCAFCVVPQVRGASRSRRAEQVIAEVKRRIAQGHLEVVLTGINLGCYRDRVAGCDFPRLIREVGATEGLRRLRLSSIEINHVTPELVRAIRETPTVSPHLHVPVQSGDDRVLKAMGRRYTAASFARRLVAAEGFNLTTDAIVGFPNETEDAFEQTLRLIDRVGITKVHVFRYSPRPGTRTAGEDPVPSAVKRRRSERLREASRDACIRRWREKIGTEDDVLVDRPGRGYGDDYTPWLVAAPVGALVRVRAGAVTDEGIVAA
jgi:threonylcarbamoyladenosine tRNA methylthiotransferase MtaB